MCPEIKLEKAAISAFPCLFIHAVLCAHLTGDSVFYTQMEGRICFTSKELLHVPGGFLGDPTKTLQHPLSPELKPGCAAFTAVQKHRWNTRHFPSAGHRDFTFVQEQHNSSAIYFLMYMREDS